MYSLRDLCFMATCIDFIRMGKRKPVCRHTSAQIEFIDPLADISPETFYPGGFCVSLLTCAVSVRIET